MVRHQPTFVIGGSSRPEFAGIVRRVRRAQRNAKWLHQRHIEPIDLDARNRGWFWHFVFLAMEAINLFNVGMNTILKTRLYAG